MKRIETWVWLAVLLLLIVANGHGQVQTAGTYDPKTGTVAVDTAKEITITDKKEKVGIIVTGSLDKAKPQIVKVLPGLAMRFIFQTDKPMLDENGQETAYLMEEIVDGEYAEMYSDRVVVTQFGGQRMEYKGKYRWYSIPSYSAKHSPVGYYLNTSGSDAAAGTIAAPWKTLAKVNRTTLAATDSVYLSAGQEFGADQEGQVANTKSDTCLVVPSSGTAGNPITFTRYGTGADPIISAAMRVQGWGDLGSGIYGRLKAVPDSTYAMWVGENKNTIMTRVMTRAALTTNQFYTKSDSIYVCVADTTWLWRSKAAAIYTLSKNYLLFDNLHIQCGCYVRTIPFNWLISGGDNIIIQNSISSKGYSGIYVSATNFIFRNSLVMDVLTGFTSAKAVNLYNITFYGLIGTALRLSEAGSNVQNCLFVSPATYFINTDAGEAITMDHNYYAASSLTNKWNNGTNHSTLLGVNGWSSAIGGQDSVGSVSSTNVTNIFDANYRPLYGSPVLNIGANGLVTTDKDGNLRGPMCDIGAYERIDKALKTGSKFYLKPGTSTVYRSNP